MGDERRAGPARDLAERARSALFGLLLLTLGAGILVPLYTDEVAWRLQLSRFVEDGGVDRATGESCGPNTIAVPPAFMWPVRLFSSAATWLVNDPLGVRLAGVAGAILAVLAIRALVRRVAPTTVARSEVEMLAWALLGLGTLPFLLVWSRPEQPILLTLLAALLVALRPEPTRSAGRLVLVTLLSLVALSYHPKAIFYLPVFGVAAMLAGPRRGMARLRWPVAASWATMVAAAAFAFRYWSHRFACPGDPVLAAKLARENVSVAMIRDGWGAAFRLVPQLLHDMIPRYYLVAATPAPPIMSGWLPPPPLPVPLVAIWSAACQLGWTAGGVIGVLAAVRAARDPSRRWAPLLAGLAIAVCATGWAAFQINKNAYESALYLPVTIVALILIRCASDRPSGKAASSLVRAAVAISIVSQLLLLASYVPRLLPTLRSGTIAGQPYSVGVFGYDRATIARAGARCGLAPTRATRRVLVDDLTYFTYARTTMPLYRLGVLGDWSGSIADPVRWLHDHGSPGAVLACAYLPADLRRRAIATGPICCLDTR